MIVDLPLPELLLSEPRIAETEVTVLDEGVGRPFSNVSTLGRALQTRDVVDWVLMVAGPPDRLAAIRAVASALFESARS